MHPSDRFHHAVDFRDRRRSGSSPRGTASHGLRTQALGRPKAPVHKTRGSRRSGRAGDLYGSIIRTFGLTPRSLENPRAIDHGIHITRGAGSRSRPRCPGSDPQGVQLCPERSVACQGRRAPRGRNMPADKAVGTGHEDRHFPAHWPPTIGPAISPRPRWGRRWVWQWDWRRVPGGSRSVR